MPNECAIHVRFDADHDDDIHTIRCVHFENQVVYERVIRPIRGSQRHIVVWYATPRQTGRTTVTHVTPVTVDAVWERTVAAMLAG